MKRRFMPVAFLGAMIILFVAAAFFAGRSFTPKEVKPEKTPAPADVQVFDLGLIDGSNVSKIVDGSTVCYLATNDKWTDVPVGIFCLNNK